MNVKEMYMDDLERWNGATIGVYLTSSKTATKGTIHYLVERLEDSGETETIAFEYLGYDEDTESNVMKNIELREGSRIRIKDKDYILRKRNC